MNKSTKLQLRRSHISPKSLKMNHYEIITTFNVFLLSHRCWRIRKKHYRQTDEVRSFDFALNVTFLP